MTDQSAEAAASEFDQFLRLGPTEVAGRYTADADPGWAIGHAINGGALMALAATALGRTLADAGHHAEPLAVTGYFLAATAPGPLTLDTEIVRTGRTMSTGQVSVRQATGTSTGTSTGTASGEAAGEPLERLRVLATFGDLGAADEQVHTLATMPVVPPPQECIDPNRTGSDLVQVPAFMERFEMRFEPASVGWALGRPSGQGRIRAWLRLADGREPDLAELLLALDALPPVAFDLGRPGWSPTLELSAHLRSRPAPGWLLVAISSVNLAGGLLEEDAEVWDSRGRLVAQSRQLARAAG